MSFGAVFTPEVVRSRARLALRDAIARRLEAKRLYGVGEDPEAKLLERWAKDSFESAATSLGALRFHHAPLGDELEQLITEHEGAL